MAIVAATSSSASALAEPSAGDEPTQQTDALVVTPPSSQQHQPPPSSQQQHQPPQQQSLPVDQSEESLFDSVGQVMKSINTWITNNSGLAARPNQARNMLEKMVVNKKKHQTADTFHSPSTTNDLTNSSSSSSSPNAMPSKKQSAKKRKAAAASVAAAPAASSSSGDALATHAIGSSDSGKAKGSSVAEVCKAEQKQRQQQQLVTSSPHVSPAGLSPPEKKAKKSISASATISSKKRKLPPEANSGEASAELAEAATAPINAADEPMPPSIECSSLSAKKKRKRSAKPPTSCDDEIAAPTPSAKSAAGNAANEETPLASVGATSLPPSSVGPKKRLIKLQRCNEAKVAQFEIFDNRPPKKRPPVSLLKLGIRAMQPRALLPGESCLISGNLYCDPAVMHNVDLAVYGDEVSVHVSAAGSLVDREIGGLSVYVVNVSPSFHQINVGDVIGYVQLRALDGSLKLYVQ